MPLRVPDVGLTKGSNPFASLRFFPFTKSLATTWSSPRWRRQGSETERKGTRKERKGHAEKGKDTHCGLWFSNLPA